jgi:hypothetical protein
LEGAVGIESLDPVFVGHIDGVARAHRNVVTSHAWKVFDAEFAGTGAGFSFTAYIRTGLSAGVAVGGFVDIAAEHEQKVAFGIELLDTEVREIHHVDVAAGVDGNAGGAGRWIVSELAGPASAEADLATGGSGALLRRVRAGIDSPTEGEEELTPSREDRDATIIGVGDVEAMVHGVGRDADR